MILLKNCHIFSPEDKGISDVLIAGKQIVAIEKTINLQDSFVKTIDCKGYKLVPGFIDAHVHIAGAGGEGGPSTRTPEMKIEHMLEAGVTTVIGCLGTDGLTRNQESVLMKVKSIRHEGLSAWMYTGAYQVPTPTILGDIGKDIAMIDEVIGAGEIAIADHRSSHPSVYELAKLASHARVGGMLGGKAGIINIHMGDAKDPFRLLYEVEANSELSLKQFLPTHCNRNDYIFEDAKTYGKKSWVDITASSYPYFPEFEIKPSKAIRELTEAGVPLEHITMTSDACGSLPVFDQEGNLERLEIGYPKSIFDEFKDLIKDEGFTIADALKPITSNVANILKLKQKGNIKTGMDADLVLLNKDFDIKYVIANGKILEGRD